MSLQEHIIGLSHVGIPVENTREAIRQYEALGFRVRDLFTIPGSQRLAAFLVGNGCTLELYESVTVGYHGAIDRWANDKYVGDAAFYNEKVGPLVRKLDSYLPLVTADMSDETVDKLFFEAVPAWNEIRYTIEDLRREYLEEKLSK